MTKNLFTKFLNISNFASSVRWRILNKRRFFSKSHFSSFILILLENFRIYLLKIPPLRHSQLPARCVVIRKPVISPLLTYAKIYVITVSQYDNHAGWRYLYRHGNRVYSGESSGSVVTFPDIGSDDVVLFLGDLARHPHQQLVDVEFIYRLL